MARLPEEREAIKCLQTLLNNLRSKYEASGKVPEYTFEHLYQQAQFSSPEVLSMVLAELVERGEIQKSVRVESPSTGGGIGDYKSILDVPETLYDWRADKELRVSPENLRIIFKFQHV